MSILSNRPDKGNRKKAERRILKQPAPAPLSHGRPGKTPKAFIEKALSRAAKSLPVDAGQGHAMVEAHALIVAGSAQEKSHPAVTFDEIRRLAGGAKLVLSDIEMMLDELPELDDANDREAFATLARNSITAALASLARMTHAPGNMGILRAAEKEEGE